MFFIIFPWTERVWQTTGANPESQLPAPEWLSPRLHPSSAGQAFSISSQTESHVPELREAWGGKWYHQKAARLCRATKRGHGRALCLQLWEVTGIKGCFPTSCAKPREWVYPLPPPRCCLTSEGAGAGLVSLSASYTVPGVRGLPSTLSCCSRGPKGGQWSPMSDKGGPVAGHGQEDGPRRSRAESSAVCKVLL